MQEVLIDSSTLAAAMASTQPPLVLDCRARLEDAEAGRALWQAGHLPDSLHIDMNRDLSAPPGEGGRHPLPSAGAFTATLQRLGVSPARRVVVLDDRGGQLAAARAWWMIARWAGHPDVRVLNGGLPGWTAAGYSLSGAEPLTAATSDWQPRYDDTAWIGVEAVTANDTQLVDARAASRFRGDEEPIDPIAGHIPGAVCRPASANLAAGGRFKPASQLAEELPRADAISVYCGSGVSACHNILAYVIAGLALPRLYVGSWSEWTRDPSRPVATGD